MNVISTWILLLSGSLAILIRVIELNYSISRELYYPRGRKVLNCVVRANSALGITSTPSSLLLLTSVVREYHLYIMLYYWIEYLQNALGHKVKNTELLRKLYNSSIEKMYGNVLRELIKSDYWIKCFFIWNYSFASKSLLSFQHTVNFKKFNTHFLRNSIENPLHCFIFCCI